MTVVTALLSVSGGYLLGSIPFGLVLTRLAGLGDVRTQGSGNIGATNVLRTGRKDLALATLILDSGKAAAAALIAWWLLGRSEAAIAGAAAFTGHCYPVWLSFRGGKGVATYLGVALALSFPLGLTLCGVWLMSAAAFGYSSLAALIAALLAPILALLSNQSWLALGLFAMTAVVFWRHRGNIGRLMRGEEPKIGRKDK